MWKAFFVRTEIRSWKAEETRLIPIFYYLNVSKYVHTFEINAIWAKDPVQTSGCEIDEWDNNEFLLITQFKW